MRYTLQGSGVSFILQGGNMKVARNVQEFYEYNDLDLTKIMAKDFFNIMERHSLEDIKNEIYEKLLKKTYIQDYRPFRFYIDEENREWHVKKGEAKFSTYMYIFIKNYILAYYGKRKPYENLVSLTGYDDSGYNNTCERKIVFKDEGVTRTNPDFMIEMERVMDRLEIKTKAKGTLICESELELSIAKCVDNYGVDGCSEKELKSLLFNAQEESTNLENLLFEKVTDTLISKNVLKIRNTDKGDRLFFLDDPIRRSLFKLFKYYLEGYKDKEISEKFNMTVAGVGALKRSLRKELQYISKLYKE